MEMIRVLLARRDDSDAVALARSATVKAQRAAALAFVASATRDTDLLEEVIGLATDSDDFKEQAAILLPALHTAANMGDRARVARLLPQLNIVQERLSDEARRAGEHARTVYLPERLRTLTEIAESLERSLRLEMLDERAPDVRHAAPTLWAGSSTLPIRTQLARALTIGKWIDIVDRLVEVEPDAYPAFTGELDRLHRA
jgi:hypothetical protein